MYALVIDSRPDQQDKFLEVLSWFGHVKAVTLATRPDDLHDDKRVPFGAVVVGELPGIRQATLVSMARDRFPRARIVAALGTANSALLDPALRAAGADAVIDSRISIWKTGLILRQALWDSGPVVPLANYSSVPGLWVETA